MKRNFLVGLGVLCVLAITSCGKAPQTEIDAANAAIAEAKTAQADLYLPQEFTSLQDSLNAILAFVETENAKTFKNFGDTKSKCDSITSKAKALVAMVEPKKAELKTKTEGLIAETKTLCEENCTLLKKCKGKAAGAMDTLKLNIALVDSNLKLSDTLMKSGDIISAYTKATIAKEISMTVSGKLKN